MRVSWSPGLRYIFALSLATAISIGLLGIDWINDQDLAPTYLVWNLFLAWIPFLLALLLVWTLRRKQWSSWAGLLLSAGWLAFLPNSFYMVSDFIHLQEVDAAQLLFNVVMFTAFIYTGVLLGFSGLYLIHLALEERLSRIWSFTVIGVLLLICSIAIYIGRDLRWNTWDMLVNPAGVLFDLSERLLHPAQLSQVLMIVLPFFVLLGGMYVVVWQAARLLKE